MSLEFNANKKLNNIFKRNDNTKPLNSGTKKVTNGAMSKNGSVFGQKHVYTYGLGSGGSFASSGNVPAQRSVNWYDHSGAYNRRTANTRFMLNSGSTRIKNQYNYNNGYNNGYNNYNNNLMYGINSMGNSIMNIGNGIKDIVNSFKSDGTQNTSNTSNLSSSGKSSSDIKGSIDELKNEKIDVSSFDLTGDAYKVSKDDLTDLKDTEGKSINPDLKFDNKGLNLDTEKIKLDNTGHYDKDAIGEIDTFTKNIETQMQNITKDIATLKTLISTGKLNDESKTKVQKLIDKLNSIKENLNTKKTEVANKKSKMVEHNTKLDKQEKELEKAKTKERTEYQKLQKKVDNLAKEINDLNTNNDEKGKNSDKIIKKCDEKTKLEQQMKELKENYDGEIEQPIT